MTMTTKWVWVPLVSLSAAACGGAADRAASPASDVAPLAVTMEKAAMTPMAESFESGGVLVARQTAIISSRILAPVVRVTVQPGDRVRRGQTVVELDGGDAAARAAGATSSLAAAQASARAASSEQAAADAALTLARATHARIAKLQQDRSATPQELDEAVAALRQAEARAAAVKNQVEAAGRSVEAAESGATVAGIARGWSTLTAPFDGLVVARHVDPGTTVGPGQPLITIEAPSALQMDVRLDASRAAGLSVGQTAEVRVETGGTTDWTPAKVTEIARVDPASHSFMVTLDVPATASWRSGYFGRARFSGPARERLTIPQAAAVARGQLSFVFVIGADDHARLRIVSLGDARDGRVEVLAGLSAGDRVVVTPPAALADGMKVRS